MQPALTDYTAGAGVAAAEAALAARAFSHDNDETAASVAGFRDADYQAFAVKTRLAALAAGWDAEDIGFMLPVHSGEIVAPITVTSPVAGNA